MAKNKRSMWKVYGKIDGTTEDTCTVISETLVEAAGLAVKIFQKNYPASEITVEDLLKVECLGKED